MEIDDVNDDGFPIGTSEYGITNSNIAKIVYGDSSKKVRIPSNLSVIGTMNTSRPKCIYPGYGFPEKMGYAPD